MAPADHPGLQVSSISLCVWMCNSGSLMACRLLQGGQTQHGACGTVWTASILSLLSSPKALSHLLALTMVNALVCGAVLYSEYKGT